MSTEHNVSPHRSDKYTKPTPRARWSAFASRWRNRLIGRRRGLGLTAVMVSTAIVAQGSIVSNAHWNDSEWGNASVGTTDCSAPEGDFTSRGEGRVLSGSLLGLDLDNLAEAKGVETTNDGTTATASAGSPVSGVPDAWADPLTVEALSAIELGLDGLLELPANNNTGVVGQFGQAQNTGEALGAAGYITNSGGIDLDQSSDGYPDLATLRLSELLNSELLGDLDLGTTLADVTDLELTTGAVAGQASLDGCAAIWSIADNMVADIIPGLERGYFVASADLSFVSSTVGKLVTEIGGESDGTCGDEKNSVLTNLECTLNGLAGNEGVIDGLTSSIGSLLGELTDGLSLGEVEVGLSVDFDLSAVRELLTGTLSDDVVSINLGDGTINIDTAALLAEANPSEYSEGLNGLAPNTNPLDDPSVINELTNRVASMLSTRINQVEEKLVQVIDAIQLHLNVKIHLTLTRGLLLPITYDIGHIEATVDCQPSESDIKGCPLGELLSDELDSQGVHATFILLPELEKIPGIGPILNLILNGVVGTIIGNLVENLVGGLGALLGNAVNGILERLHELPDKVVALTEQIVGTVTNLYSGLFGGLEPIVSLTINAQNNAANNTPEPQDWEALEDGRYDVAAIRIGVLDALGDDAVRLYLGRGSVGPSRSVAQTAQP